MKYFRYFKFYTETKYHLRMSIQIPIDLHHKHSKIKQKTNVQIFQHFYDATFEKFQKPCKKFCSQFLMPIDSTLKDKKGDT